VNILRKVEGGAAMMKEMVEKYARKECSLRY